MSIWQSIITCDTFLIDSYNSVTQKQEIFDKLSNRATTQANSWYKRKVTRAFDDQIRQLKLGLEQ